MEPDMSATAVIHQRLAMRGLLPAKHFVDSGYVDADLLVSSRRDHGVSLEGPVRKISTWASRAGHGYDMPNFKIDWERKQVICPQGKVSVSWAPAVDSGGKPKIHVQFGRADCGNCKARSLVSLLAITVSSMSATLSLVTNVEVVKPKLFTKIQRSFSFISLVRSSTEKVTDFS
jgi:hypothetical protein